jgi:hypothetical protein
VSGRIAEVFRGLQTKGQTGLVTYVTGGDPDLAQSADILRALDRAGADVIRFPIPSRMALSSSEPPSGRSPRGPPCPMSWSSWDDYGGN